MGHGLLRHKFGKKYVLNSPFIMEKLNYLATSKQGVKHHT